MEGREIVKLAADFSAGTVTAAYIKQVYGEGVLSTVAALATGGIAGIAVDKLIDLVDDQTGIVTAAGSVVDVGISSVKSVFDWF